MTNHLLEKNSSAVQKRLASHEFTDEGGEEYEGSEFGGFGDYFRRKKIKLQNLDVELRNAAAGEKPQIFKGIAAHVTGYTQPPLHVLHKELVQHGAVFLQYLDSKTMATHIIASTMPPKKSVDFTRYKVVKPAWIMDSIQAGKLLPWSDYRVIDESPRQKTIKFDGGKLSSQQVQKSPRGYREQTQNSFYNQQFQSEQSPSPQRSVSPYQPRFQRIAEANKAQLFSSPYQPRSASKLSRTYEAIDENEDEMEVDILQEPLPTLENHDEQTSPKEKETDIFMDFPPSGQKMSPPPPQPPPGKPMTSEEHNAALLSDPKIRKSSTANPDFLKQYYSESRLHHLSTWKAELKSRLQKLAAERGPAAKSNKRKSGFRRYIMHVDFDSFFCAVSLKQAPELRDKPAVVAHGNGSGSEIASCNYPAREFGVKNGMWMKRAMELCPELKVLPYDFPGYEEASKQFYDAILDVGGIVQSVSIDEALIDVTELVLSAAASSGVGLSEGSIWREQAKVDEIASGLRAEIKKKTGCDVSVGIGANVLLAKIALRKAKPAGQYQIKPEEVLDILADLKVDSLPGVAYSIGGKLEEIGIKFAKDIRETSKERLITVLGPKTGEKLWEYSRGIDRTEVWEQPVRKSVSADVNWGIRFINQEEAETFVRNLCQELERRLLNEGVKGKQLTMKIMKRSSDAPLDPPKHLGHGKCDTFNKSTAFGVATHSAETIGKEAVAILRSYKFTPGDLRGIGVQMTKLEPLKPSALPEGSQKKLNFGPVKNQKPKQEPIDEEADSSTSTKRQKPEQEQIEDENGPSESKSRRPSHGIDPDSDPITEDPLTPRKQKVHPALALARANAADPKATTPLNMRGTQFIIPSNPDPTVLAELPHDIRSRLLAQANKQKQTTSAISSRSVSPTKSKPKSRSNSPALSEEIIPPDVDPEVFNALPEDMKAEVLASYGLDRRRGQTVLPQSPRKDRIINRPKDKQSPSKRGRGGGIKNLFSRAHAKERQHDAEAGRYQTSLLVGKKPPAVVVEDELDSIEDLDENFLAELPEDVRKEVIEYHKRRKLAQKSGILNLERRFPANRRNDDFEDAAAAPRGIQMRLEFPPKPPKIDFMQSGVSGIQEIKEMIKEWFRTTKEEGPNKDDVEGFGLYLKRVVTEERNMEKVRRLVKFLEVMVDEDEEGNGWGDVLESIKEAVQDGMGERGLSRMEF
ncbi:DNA repair protein rev1 [Podospora fimiseda]|uniref:DNA repair protein REV1 n=1 Tax=Podospora fimiseda TaxID=252190 RepID=A0AAN7BMN5_9PEZI|nr:DNA repair protein rev1 [Podospora fimiseda]